MTPATPTTDPQHSAEPTGKPADSLLADAARDGMVQGMIYQAISVQRPVVLEYLKSLRREKPEASPAELMKTLESRYVRTVTVASTGVGASAAIPGVGIPLALGLGAADLLFFYETSALFVLSAAELHGVEVADAARARPLVFGMLLGEKSQTTVRKMVLSAAGLSKPEEAARKATTAFAETLPNGWGETLTTQVPDTALAPLTVVMAKEALKQGAKFGTGALGKAVPFGVGAVVGGVGSFTFGRDVVRAAQQALTGELTEFPESLADYQKKASDPASPSRAALAMQAAADQAASIGEAVRGRTVDVVDVFRSVDLDGDGVPDEARAKTAAKRTGRAITDVAARGAGAAGRGVGAAGRGVGAAGRGVGSVFKRRRSTEDGTNAEETIPVGVDDDDHDED